LRNARSFVRLLVGLVASHCATAQGIITTVAGTDPVYPGSSFSALSASFGQLGGVAVNPINGEVYFSSQTRSLIVKFNPTLNSVSIVAGIGVGGYSGDGGPAANGALNYPQQIAFDRAGDLYIADFKNGAIRKIDPQGTITTVASTLSHPSGVAIGPDDTLYASDYRRVYHIASDGEVSVIAGGDQPGYSGDGGPAINALVYSPYGLAFDGTGNLLVADSDNNRIRRIDTKGIISTIAGNGQAGSTVAGPATSSPVPYPSGVASDAAGNVYFGSGGYGQLSKVDQSGILSILNPNASTLFLTAPGPISKASLYPTQLTFDQAGNLYIVDTNAGCLYRLSATGTLQVAAAYAPNFAIADGGPGVLAGLNFPSGIGLMADGSLLIADQFNQRIRKLSPTGTITTVVGAGSLGVTNAGPALSANLFDPNGVASDASGNIYLASGGNVYRVTASSILSDVKQQYYPIGIAVDPQGNVVIAAGPSNVVLRVTSEGISTIIAGNGQAGFSGDGGPAVSATLNAPDGVGVDQKGNVYIGDSNNERIRKVSLDGTISTIAGGGTFEIDGVPATQSALIDPTAIACDELGNVYFAQYDNHIREITEDGFIFTIAGTGNSDFAGDGGLATTASLNQPSGIAVDGAGNIYISDALNNRIRKILAAPPPISIPSTQVTISAPSHGSLTQYDIPVSSPVQGLAYSVGFFTKTGGDWLGSSSLQGQAPGVLSITVDPSSLGPGTYQGTVTVNSPYATPQALNIAVTFQVGQAQTASLSLGAQSLSFALAGSDVQASAPLIVSNQGGGSILFTASVATATGGAWLQVSPKSGTATPASPASLSVTVTRGTLPVGTYSGSITVASATTGQVVTIPVTLAVNPAPQTIVLSQTGLTFTAVAQGGTTIPQSLGILNIGSGSMSWTAATATLSGGNWLSLSQATGTVTQPFLDVSFVDVSVNAQGLPAGQYFGNVQVTAPGASNSPQTVLVVLDVLPAGSNPGPQLRPTGLVFTGIAGGANAGSQTITVANVTSNPVTYGSSVSYVNGNNWIKYLPANATVAPDTPAQITVQPDFTNLGAGVLRAALTLAFDDGSIRAVSILAVVAPPGTTPSLRQRSTVGGAAQTSTCTPTKLLPVVTQLGTGPSVSTGWPVAMVADVVDDCGSPMTSGTVVVSFTDGDPPLPMISLGNGEWSATWQPEYSNPAGVTVSLLAQEPGLVGTIQTLIGFQGAQTLPTASGGVLNAVTLLPGPLAPGELVWIKGSGLADRTAVATTTPLLQQLAGASVFVGSGSANLLYADSTQLIGQVPFSLPANSSQQIILSRDSSLGVPSAVIVAATQPALFTERGSGIGQALIYQANAAGVAASLADSSNPAQAGATIVIYCSGLGVVDAQGNSTNIPSVSIGGVAANLAYSGLALAANYPPSGAPTLLGLVSAGLGGLYQITATVPAGLASGPAQVIISSVGQTSQLGVTMMIAGSASVATPVITSIDTAGGFPTIAQNGFIEIKGSNLSPSAVSSPDCAPGYCWQASDFVNNQMPTALHGVSVTVNGKPAFVYFISPTQINALTPLDSTTGSVQVVVNNNSVSSTPFATTEIAVAPSFLLFNAQGYIAATHLNNTGCAASGLVYCYVGPTTLYPGASTPAAPGETIVAYAVGFGLPTTTLTSGSATQSGLLPTSPSCKIGGNPATVGFAGLISPGLYQFNMTIPSTAANGDNTITCTYGGSSTPSSDLITVQR
jgi:uncharacterized protein (TIGR03437 family)